MLGLSAPSPDTRNFSGKVSWYFKSFAQNEVAWSVQKFLGIFKGIFTKIPLKRRFGTAVPTFYDKIKSTAPPCFLRMRWMLGLSAPNPDTRNFSGKVSWNFKSFAKMKWCSCGEGIYINWISERLLLPCGNNCRVLRAWKKPCTKR